MATSNSESPSLAPACENDDPNTSPNDVCAATKQDPGPKSAEESVLDGSSTERAGAGHSQILRSSSANPEESPEPEDIEEGRHAYRPGGFHPVYIDDVYHNRYEVLRKIGYGAYSTVWLVRDLHERQEEKKFRALKVLSAECYGQGKDTFEREVLRHLRDGNQGLMGYRYVCHLIEDFEIQGPNGTHVCFVFELMGETLRSFGVWFKDDMVPYAIMRRFTIQLILALDYAHESGVIHTDIKPDNIFVKFRDYSQIQSGYLVDLPPPRQDRSEESYTVIPSRPLRRFYFNEDQSVRMDECDVVLGDWGVASWADRHLTENIQPIALRAPEVLIGAPWDSKADYWNLGAVVIEVFRAVRLFDGRSTTDGKYHVREHLAEMERYFGPFPADLLRIGDQKLVKNFFNEEGRVKDAKTQSRPELTSDWFTPGLDERDRANFLSFLQEMMKINPRERPIPEELLELPWLHALRRATASSSA